MNYEAFGAPPPLHLRREFAELFVFNFVIVIQHLPSPSSFHGWVFFSVNFEAWKKVAVEGFLARRHRWHHL